MSLGGSKSQAMNSAVAAVIRMGMTVCVAAGNETVWSIYPPPFSLALAPPPLPTYLKTDISQTSRRTPTPVPQLQSQLLSPLELSTIPMPWPATRILATVRPPS